MAEGLSPDQAINLYELKYFRGKGFRLVACQRIAMGTQILCEKPIFTHNSNLPLDFKLFEDTLAKKQSEPPIVDRILLMSYRNAFGATFRDYPDDGRITAFPYTSAVLVHHLRKLDMRSHSTERNQSSVWGLFLRTSCINYDHFPNTHRTWNIEKQWLSIRAIRDIEGSEELTVGYDYDWPFTKRPKFVNEREVCRNRCFSPQSVRRRISIEGTPSLVGLTEAVQQGKDEGAAVDVPIHPPHSNRLMQWSGLVCRSPYNAYHEREEIDARVERRGLCEELQKMRSDSGTPLLSDSDDPSRKCH